MPYPINPGSTKPQEKTFFESWSLIVCNLGATTVAVLIVFGLDPQVVWLTVAVAIAITGGALAGIDKNSRKSSVGTIVGVFSLIVSIAALAVAIITLVKDP